MANCVFNNEYKEFFYFERNHDECPVSTVKKDPILKLVFSYGLGILDI